MSMKDITDKMSADMNTALRANIIGAFGAIIRGTPVDTGRARGNWQCSLGSPVTNEIDRLDPNGSGAVSEVIATVKIGEVNYLSNNVPYIRRLEYEGHSKQAPNGMVRIALARFGIGEIV